MGSAARLTGKPPPAAESVQPPALRDFVPCDATASGSETAQVQLSRGTATLSLCGHHYNVYELVLATAGWRVTGDTRGRLR